MPPNSLVNPLEGIAVTTRHEIIVPVMLPEDANLDCMDNSAFRHCSLALDRSSDKPLDVVAAYTLEKPKVLEVDDVVVEDVLVLLLELLVVDVRVDVELRALRSDLELRHPKKMPIDRRPVRR